ncbi:DUF2783 domain-containing protein [Alcaligenes sp. SDU_A2]|uniref:DUF2783 domain-containing protein n=1 Tax=Alcaligenes sp. SDU_A2 TaxID=3136634 RepID=UPI002C9FEB56|nr:DUF2783 domain-containing protein [Alcaligenes sp.]HRL27263.1 DUF2783 domain-containing protein [Alcaligenes sp.]
MPALNTTRPMDRADDFYELLINAHQGLSTAQSHAMNASLVLLLCNHIDSLEIVAQALEAARQASQEQTA